MKLRFEYHVFSKIVLVSEIRWPALLILLLSATTFFYENSEMLLISLNVTKAIEAGLFLRIDSLSP